MEPAATKRRKPTPKLHPGWRPGRKKRRQALAATMIQKCFRSYLLRKAFRTSRVSVTQSFQALRAFQHARDRKHWRSVDLRKLKREELRLVALSLNLPSTGKKVVLLGRIQRWVDQHVRANDLAAQAAAKALETHVKGQGTVYFCEAYPGAVPIDIRPLRGKGITSVAAGADSDAVYAVDGTRGALWLCKTGGLSSQIGLCCALPKNPNSSVFEDPIESRWLVNPVFIHTLRTEHIVDVRVAKSHAVALAKAGELFSWGENPHGELGFAVESADAVARNRATVVAAIATYRAVAVAAGQHHTIAVCDEVAGHDGVTFCWGSNSHGQLGTATTTDKQQQSRTNGTISGNSVAFPKPFVMHQVEALRAVNIRKVACGALHSLALSAEGKVFSWGCSDGGRLGHGDFKTQQQQQTGKPAMVRGALETLAVLEIACGPWHSACIATADPTASSGRVFTWGAGIYGQLGAGVQQVLHEPHSVRIPQSTVVNEEFATQIACGMHHTAVLTASNDVFMWGSVQRFSPHPQKLQQKDNSVFGKIASLSCGRTFVIFSTLSCDAESYEKREAHRLWRVQPTVIPRLDLRKIPSLPLSASCFSVEKHSRTTSHPPPPPRLEPQVDRKAREAEELREAQRIDAIDIDAIVHPLCRVCWRCEGFQPSPLRLWVCRHCCHEKQLHGVRPQGVPLGEYEAIRKLQCLYRARKARRLMQKAREKHYQRVFSIKHNEFFFYNLWRDKVSWRRPPEIGDDVDIPIRDPDVLPTITAPLTKFEAAAIIQSHRHGCLARRVVKKRLEKMYEKHFDLEKEQVYYVVRQGPFGVVTVADKDNKLWTPPALLRRLYDLGEPIEIRRLKRFANMTPDDAAQVIQLLFRAYQQRKHAKRIIQSRYKKIFDDATGLHFYYNTVTKESTWEKPKLLRDNEDAASTSSVSSNAKAASPQLRAKKKRQPRREKFADADAAARTIQSLFRRFVCRKQFFELLSRRYRKYMDPHTGKPYYYDTTLNAASWLKPAVLGEFDLEVMEQAGASTSTATGVGASGPSSRKSPSPRKSTIIPEAAKSSSSPRRVAGALLAAAVPHMSERARVKRHKRRLQKLRQMSRDDAASRLQRVWRARKARDQLRQLLFEAYEKIYDPATGHYYYYNKKTGVVKWETPWMIDDSDVRVMRRVKRRRLDAIVEPGEAKAVVCGFLRYAVARNELYRLLYARIQKVWDPQTRQYYYFDKRNGQSSWKKPVTLRHNDLPATQS